MKRAVPRWPLLLPLGVAILGAAVYLGTPASRHQPTPSTAVAPLSKPSEAPSSTADESELANHDRGPRLPDQSQQAVNRIRESGMNLWWADAIEIVWMKGFAAAVEHLRQFVPPENLDEKAADLLCVELAEKLELVIEGLPLIHAPNHRRMVTNTAAANWARKDPVRLLNFAREHFAEEAKNYVFKQVVGVYAKGSRFADAASVLNSMPRSESRASVLEQLASTWGRNDMEDAFTWARALQPESDQLAAEQHIITAVADRASVDRIRELAAQYATEQTQATWNYWIGDKLLAADTEKAIAWADALPADRRGGFQGRIAAKIAQSDLAGGTAFALHIDDESARTQAIDSIHRGLGIKPATEWVWTLPDEYQHRVVVGTVTRWYREDEEAAKSWVAGLSPGRVRDRAAMWLSWEVNRSDPAGAAKLASSIADAQFKEWAFDELNQRAK